eukprot:UN22297
MITGVCFMMYYCHAKLTKEVLKLLGIRSSIISKHQLMKVSLNVHERRLGKDIRIFDVRVFV